MRERCLSRSTVATRINASAPKIAATVILLPETIKTAATSAARRPTKKMDRDDTGNLQWSDHK